MVLYSKGLELKPQYFVYRWDCNTYSGNFHIRTVRLDIIKVLFIHQLMYQWVVLKNNIEIYIETAPTYFGVTVTPSSGSALICAYQSYSC